MYKYGRGCQLPPGMAQGLAVSAGVEKMIEAHHREDKRLVNAFVKEG